MNQWMNARKAGQKEGGEGEGEGKTEERSRSHPRAVSTEVSVTLLSLAQQLSTVYKTWKSVSKHVWIHFYGLLINPIKMATTQQFSENARAKFFFFFFFFNSCVCAIRVTPTHSYFCGPKNFLLDRGYFKWGFTENIMFYIIKGGRQKVLPIFFFMGWSNSGTAEYGRKFHQVLSTLPIP